MDYKAEAGNLNVGNRDVMVASRPTNEHVLASMTFALSPGVLDTVPRRVIFQTPAEVSGDIINYWVEIAGVKRPWGVEALVGQEFEVWVDAKYYAAGAKHTRMDLTVYKPSGVIDEYKDDDRWPYEGPGVTIHFHITGFLGEAFDINEAGEWEAKLEYVWVE